MKTIVALLLATIAFVAYADPVECPLKGTFKSDAARTLADIAARDALSARSKTFVSNDHFGHMTHEWSCSELRAWFDYHERPEPMRYKIAERSAESLLVTFADDPNADLQLHIEGECYKMHIAHKGYYEYFCPVAKL